MLFKSRNISGWHYVTIFLIINLLLHVQQACPCLNYNSFWQSCILYLEEDSVWSFPSLQNSRYWGRIWKSCTCDSTGKPNPRLSAIMRVMMDLKMVPRNVLTPNTRAHSSLVSEDAIWNLENESETKNLMYCMQKCAPRNILCGKKSTQIML